VRNIKNKIKAKTLADLQRASFQAAAQQVSDGINEWHGANTHRWQQNQLFLLLLGSYLFVGFYVVTQTDQTSLELLSL